MNVLRHGASLTRSLFSLLVFLAMIDCGGTAAQKSAPNTTLHMELDADHVEVQAGQTLLVQLVVVGASNRPVSIASRDLPAFATIQDHILRLAPQRADSGDYRITLTATAGADSATATLLVSVLRANTAPRVVGFVLNGELVPQSFVYESPVELDFYVCDDEGDSMRLDLEIVESGAPFTGTPTHSVSVAGPCNHAIVSVTNAAPGRAYTFRRRLVDALGAWSCPPPLFSSLDGLCGLATPGVAFRTGPDFPYACRPAGASCGSPQKCCGTCDTGVCQ